jgi:hypothetical protein
VRVGTFVCGVLNSVLFTWVYIHARGSVLIATLFHGAINLSQGLFSAAWTPPASTGR